MKNHQSYKISPEGFIATGTHQWHFHQRKSRLASPAELPARATRSTAGKPRAQQPIRICKYSLQEPSQEAVKSSDRYLLTVRNRVPRWPVPLSTLPTVTAPARHPSHIPYRGPSPATLLNPAPAPSQFSIGAPGAPGLEAMQPHGHRCVTLSGFPAEGRLGESRGTCAPRCCGELQRCDGQDLRGQQPQGVAQAGGSGTAPGRGAGTCPGRRQLRHAGGAERGAPRAARLRLLPVSAPGPAAGPRAQRCALRGCSGHPRGQGCWHPADTSEILAPNSLLQVSSHPLSSSWKAASDPSLQ